MYGPTRPHDAPRLVAKHAKGAPLRVLGIDLGTTNFTIAEIRWDPGDADAPQVRCLEIPQPTRQGNLI